MTSGNESGAATRPGPVSDRSPSDVRTELRAAMSVVNDVYASPQRKAAASARAEGLRRELNSRRSPEGDG
jgi:hypothetical protein